MIQASFVRDSSVLQSFRKAFRQFLTSDTTVAA
jgi:hypothetical protein